MLKAGKQRGDEKNERRNIRIFQVSSLLFKWRPVRCKGVRSEPQHCLGGPLVNVHTHTLDTHLRQHSTHPSTHSTPCKKTGDNRPEIKRSFIIFPFSSLPAKGGIRSRNTEIGTLQPFKVDQEKCRLQRLAAHFSSFFKILF